MRRYKFALLILVLVIAFFNKNLKAQSEIDTTVNLDILTVPNSPAFNLLEISPAAVDKPTTPNDFAISIANASNNFSVLPRNYAVEFLPISFFPKSKESYAKFTNDAAYVKSWNQKLWNTVSQTFLISGGFSTDENVETTTPDFIKTRSGLGFKFSLTRGKIDTAFEEYKNSIDVIRSQLKVLHSVIDNKWETHKQTDMAYLMFASQRDTLMNVMKRVSMDSTLTLNEKAEKNNYLKKQFDELNKLKTFAEDEYKTMMLKEDSSALVYAAQALKKQIEQIKFKRYGWLMDFAGGMVIGFRNDNFQNSVLQQYAFWFNGGYACKQGFSFMALARYSNLKNAFVDAQGVNSDKAFYDFGGKIEFQTNDNKLSLNGEIISRVSTGLPLVRYTFNAGYQVGKNQALTLSVGKAFAGTAQYGGNLIAALNFVKTFGSSRSLVPNAK
ncbi:MAG: hypothetical protein ACOYN4_10945 [Bacteroidales bacterium]